MISLRRDAGFDWAIAAQLLVWGVMAGEFEEGYMSLSNELELSVRLR